MTCELCNQNRMDVKTWSTAGGHIVVATCNPCTRKVIDIELECMNAFKDRVKYLIDQAKASKDEPKQQTKTPPG